MDPCSGAIPRHQGIAERYQQVFGFGLVLGAGAGAGFRSYLSEDGDVRMVGTQLTTSRAFPFELALGWAF